MPTKIEWCDETWNPITGCTPISAGCQNCYARRMVRRLAGRCGYDKENPFRITLHPNRMNQPYLWRKPRRIFVCSMGDIFHTKVPALWISLVLKVIKNAPRHIFIFLTKRPEAASVLLNGNSMFVKDVYDPTGWKFDAPPNLWFGVTIEADEYQSFNRLYYLRKIPAPVKFISFEPLLGPVDGPLGRGIDWVIVGGETGPNARPMNPNWVLKLRDSCQVEGIPFFFKSWGEWAPKSVLHGPALEGFTGREGCFQAYTFKDGSKVFRVGKKMSGRLLGGRLWNQFPVGQSYPFVVREAKT